MARGGARPGAGRPKGSTKRSAEELAAEAALRDGKTGTKRFKSALEFAMATINDPDVSMDAKIRLAVAAMPFQHPKLESVGQGKKDQKAQAAREAAVGKLAPPPAPKLIVDNR